MYRRLGLRSLTLFAGSVQLLWAPCANAQVSPDQPAPAPAPAQSRETVTGPGDREIFAQGEPGRLNFRRVAKSGTKGEVVGANTEFDTDRLPATFAATLDSGESCTATLIGPQVLLTAAHCVDRKVRDSRGRWLTNRGAVKNGNGTLLATILRCDMAPAYIAADPRPGRPRNEQDFALCQLSSPINSISAETIALEAPEVSTGAMLMLVGYGCTDSDLVDGRITAGTRNKGVLGVGINTVEAGGPAGWLSLRGTVGTTQAILCPGDSGGGALAHATVEPGPGNDSGWRIVAVNSAVGPAKGGGPNDYISYLAPLADPAFRSFLDEWMGPNPAHRPGIRAVCGVTLTHLTGRCRR